MVHIREAREDDIARFKAVVKSSVMELCGGHYTPEQIAALLAQYPGPEVYRKWLKERVLVVATDERGVIGFAQFNPSRAFIEAVHVSPEHAKKGIGRKLVRAIEEKARRCGTRRIIVVSSLNAVSFYSKCDYVRKGSSTYRCKEGVELEAVRFEKEISD